MSAFDNGVTTKASTLVKKIMDHGSGQDQDSPKWGSTSNPTGASQVPLLLIFFLSNISGSGATLSSDHSSSSVKELGDVITNVGPSAANDLLSSSGPAAGGVYFTHPGAPLPSTECRGTCGGAVARHAILPSHRSELRWCKRSDFLVDDHDTTSTSSRKILSSAGGSWFQWPHFENVSATLGHYGDVSATLGHYGDDEIVDVSATLGHYGTGPGQPSFFNKSHGSPEEAKQAVDAWTGISWVFGRPKRDDAEPRAGARRPLCLYNAACEVLGRGLLDKEILFLGSSNERHLFTALAFCLAAAHDFLHEQKMRDTIVDLKDQKARVGLTGMVRWAGQLLGGAARTSSSSQMSKTAPSSQEELLPPRGFVAITPRLRIQYETDFTSWLPNIWLSFSGLVLLYKRNFMNPADHWVRWAITGRVRVRAANNKIIHLVPKNLTDSPLARRTVADFRAATTDFGRAGAVVEYLQHWLRYERANSDEARPPTAALNKLSLEVGEKQNWHPGELAAIRAELGKTEKLDDLRSFDDFIFTAGKEWNKDRVERVNLNVIGCGPPRDIRHVLLYVVRMEKIIYLCGERNSLTVYVCVWGGRTLKDHLKYWTFTDVPQRVSASIAPAHPLTEDRGSWIWFRSVALGWPPHCFMDVVPFRSRKNGTWGTGQTHRAFARVPIPPGQDLP